MKKSIFGTPIVASAVLLMVFATAFATYSTTRQGDSSAASVGCDVSTGPVRLFFQDNPAYATRGQRVLFSSDETQQSRTFTLPNDARITPGKYEVRSISSDAHYAHRSSAPNLDIQKQLDETYYIEIDGQRTPSKTTDFTDFYDWRGGDGELIQDDDNNLDSIPNVVRNTWQGEYLGSIDVTNATTQVTAHHAAKFDGLTAGSTKPDSIIPTGVILNCVDPGSPVLEIEKNVDGDADGAFNPLLEQTQVGDTISWQIIGRNVGDADDPNAQIHSCAPAGTTFVAGSATVENGGGSVTEADGCIQWSGPLAQAATVELRFDTVLDDFSVCDAIDVVNQKCSCDASIYSGATSTTRANPADTDDAAVEIAPVAVSIDKTVDGNGDSEFSESEEISPGEDFTWAVVISNTGQTEAKKVRVTDEAPAGVTFKSYTLGTTGGPIVNDTLSVDTSLDVNATKTIEIIASITDSAAFNQCDADSNGSCINEAVLLVDIGEGYEEDSRDDANVTIPAPSLTIEKQVDGIDEDSEFSELEEVRADTEFEWSITVSNTGSVDAENYRISDVPTVVEGYSYSEVSILDQSSDAAVLRDSLVVQTDGSIAVDVNLPASATITLGVKATLASDAVFTACDERGGEAGQCRNIANLFALDNSNAPVDADESQDGLQPYASDDASVLLLKDPVVTIQKTVDGNGDGQFSEKEEITPGKPFVWKVVTSNAADAGLAKDFEIRETLASGVDFSPVDASSVSVTAIKATVISTTSTDRTFDWFGDIEPGGSVEFLLTTIVSDVDAFLSCDNIPYANNTPGDQTCPNHAEVVRITSDPNDVDPTVDSDGADVTMQLDSNLEIIKLVDGSDDDNEQPGRFSENNVEEVLVATPFTWKIVASNTGDADEPNARVIDVLPDGVSIIEDSIRYSVEGVENQGDLQYTETAASLVWNGELKRNESLAIEFNTIIADVEAYEACLAASNATSNPACINTAQVGVVESGAFNEQAQDPAYVFVRQEPVLEIEKYVDGDVDDDSEFREYTKREEISAENSTVSWQIIGCNTGNINEPLATIYPWRSVEGLKDSITYVAGSARVVSGPGDITEVDGEFVWQGQLNYGDRGQAGTCVVIQYETEVVSPEEFAKCDIADANDSDATCTLDAVIGTEDTASNGAFMQADSDEAQIYREPKGELTVLKTVDGDNDDVFGELEEIVPGVAYRYRVVVTNEGDAAVENAAMYDALPEGVSVTGDPETLPADFGTASVITGTRMLVLWTVDSLEPGASVQITFPVTIANVDAFNTCDDKDGNQNKICTNDAAAGIATSIDDWKGLTENDSAEVVVKPLPELFIEKTVDGTDVDTDFSDEEQVTTDGADFTYKVRFGNTGNGDAPNSKLMTGVMPGLTYVSHSMNPADVGDVVYDADAGSLVWTGDLPAGANYELQFVVHAQSLGEYRKCDNADNEEDLRCICTATLTYEEIELEDKAIVNTDKPETPDIEIDKLVDGNADDKFSENEEIAVGDEIAWRVEATNTTSVDAEGLTLTDNLVAGMKFVAGSLKEVDGAEYGVVTLVDDDIVWQGDIPAGVTVSFEFKTTFTSLQGFQQCNFSDGNASDEECTNPVVIAKTDSGKVLGIDDASVDTPLPQVLAYTGTATVNYIIVVGVVIAAITIATAVIAYVTRPRENGGMGGGPTVTIVPST